MINHYILILLMKVRNPAPPGMYKIRCNSGSFDLELRNTTVSCHLEQHKILLALYLGLVLTLKDIRNLVFFCDFILIHWRAIGCIHISRCFLFLRNNNTMNQRNERLLWNNAFRVRVSK